MINSTIKTMLYDCTYAMCDRDMDVTLSSEKEFNGIYWRSITFPDPESLQVFLQKCESYSHFVGFTNIQKISNFKLNLCRLCSNQLYYKMEYKHNKIYLCINYNEHSDRPIKVNLDFHVFPNVGILDIIMYLGSQLQPDESYSAHTVDNVTAYIVTGKGSNLSSVYDILWKDPNKCNLYYHKSGCTYYFVDGNDDWYSIKLKDVREKPMEINVVYFRKLNRGLV